MTTSLVGGGPGGFKGVRLSKFRHLYGKGSRREECYEGVRTTGSAHDSAMIAANPKFIAVVVEVAGGGAFQVIPLKWTGKQTYHLGRVTGHNGAVNDLAWDPFNDNLLASASDDTTVKLWFIPDQGDSGQELAELAGHSRRVSYVLWHPSAQGILASCGYDHRILIWNTRRLECCVEVDDTIHPDTIYSLSFSPDGNFLATTCKDKQLRIINPRSGLLISEGIAHSGSKASKVVILGDTRMVATTGFSQSSRRQMALYKLGDGNIRYYELVTTPPYLYFLSEFQSRFPQRGLAVTPKRAVNPGICEVFRFYKLHSTQQLVEPISLIVPRKSESFQRDLYPPTFGPTAGMTGEEWLCGMDRTPIPLSLSPTSAHKPIHTCKPVQVLKDSQSAAGSTILASDMNNERKFMFLAQATAPDYRKIEERDDYGDIIKQKQVRERVNKLLASESKDEGGCCSEKESDVSNNQAEENGPADDSDAEDSEDEDEDEEDSEDLGDYVEEEEGEEEQSECPALAPQSIKSSHPSSVITKASKNDLERQSSSQLSADNSSQYSTHTNQSSSVSPKEAATKPSRFGHIRPPSNPPTASAHPPPGGVQHILPKKPVTTKPGRIYGGPIVNNQSQHKSGGNTSVIGGGMPVVLNDAALSNNYAAANPNQQSRNNTSPHLVQQPFRVQPQPKSTSHWSIPPSADHPPTVVDNHHVTTNGLGLQQSNGNAGEAAVVGTETTSSNLTSSSKNHQYAAQIRQIRELMESAETKDERIRTLENQLANTKTLVTAMDEDIASYKYEIQWKDKRISFLESEIQKSTSSTPTGSQTARDNDEDKAATQQQPTHDDYPQTA